jgi:hypothetical protein
MDRKNKRGHRVTFMQRTLRNTLLYNKHTLFIATVVAVLFVIAVEGRLTSREASSQEFENPFFGIQVSPQVRSDIR